ncbi:MAG TPA: EamA family transporter [Sphingobium sp.]|uniref:EamA family transporter n=1 Tax=Sphingobium sp. TaxID=1912891 RepID=UPI002ED6BA85
METRNQGYLFGLAGVLVFSGSVPATRAAVSGFDPLFLTAARASIAALVGAVPLLMFRAPRPLRRDLVALTLVSACVVIGFPLLSALALRHMPAARGLLFMGLLPLSTATFGVHAFMAKSSKVGGWQKARKRAVFRLPARHSIA